MRGVVSQEVGSVLADRGAEGAGRRQPRVRGRDEEGLRQLRRLSGHAQPGLRRSQRGAVRDERGGSGHRGQDPHVPRPARAHVLLRLVGRPDRRRPGRLPRLEAGAVPALRGGSVRHGLALPLVGPVRVQRGGLREAARAEREASGRPRRAGTRRYASTRSRSRPRPGSRACRGASSGTCSASARRSSRSACSHSTSRRSRSSTASALRSPGPRARSRNRGSRSSPAGNGCLPLRSTASRTGRSPLRSRRRPRRRTASPAPVPRARRSRSASPRTCGSIPAASTASLSGRGRPIVAGAPVTIQRNAGSGWTNVATAELDATGHFSADLTVTPASYRARFAPRHGVLAGVSPILRVVARARRLGLRPERPVDQQAVVPGPDQGLRLLAGAPAARVDQDRGHRLGNRRQARRVPGPDLRVEELRLLERARRHAGSRNVCRR